MFLRRLVGDLGKGAEGGDVREEGVLADLPDIKGDRGAVGTAITAFLGSEGRRRVVATSLAVPMGM
jgi:hypothetical protein